MALIGPIRKTPEQGGSDKLSVEDYGYKKERTTKETYIAYFDIGDDTNFVRGQMPSGLNLGSPHPTAPGQVVIGVDFDCNGRADDNKPGNQWAIKLDYGPIDPNDIKDPLEMSPRISFLPEQVPEPVFQDVEGKPITNPAGDYYDPPIERPGYTGVLRAVVNQPNRAIYTTWLGLTECVNQDAWLGFAEKTVRFRMPALPEREWHQDSQTYFYPFVLEWEYNPKGWKARPLRSGYRGKDENGKIVMLMDDGGNPLSSPGLLTPDGVHLKPPVDPEFVSFDEYDIHQEADFSVFDLTEEDVFS